MTQSIAHSMWWPWLLVIGLAGCGGDKPLDYNNNVKGTIKLEGVPVGNVQVTFVPQLGVSNPAPSSSAMTDASGNFQLKCDNQKPGAVIATHRVIVRQGRPKDTGSGGDREDRTGGSISFSIPATYSVASRTPLEVQVRKDQSVYDLELKQDQ